MIGNEPVAMAVLHQSLPVSIDQELKVTTFVLGFVGTGLG